MCAARPSKASWPSSFRIGRKHVGPGRGPFVIAELSANHRGSIDEALRLIDAAADVGADAIKLQTYTPDTITLPVRSKRFRVGKGLWQGKYLHDLYAEAMTPWEWHCQMARRARQRGLVAFSTPFDETAVDFLEKEMRPPAYKIASFEVNHIPLLKRVAATRKPVILSTGMATEREIATAVKTLQRGGCPALVLLKCVSAYPSDPRDFNLRALVTLRERFHTPVGLSDHTMSDEVALGSVALGACVVEKHLTLERSSGGIDAGFSLEPEEFARMVRGLRVLQQALGNPTLGPTRQDRAQRRFRRSIFVSQDVAAGEVLTPSNLRVVRPADGLEPSRWQTVLGKRAARALRAGRPLQEGDWR